MDAIFDKEEKASTETITIRTCAVKASRRGGSARPSAQSPARVKLEITDTGTGMSNEIRERCLEPFVSTKGDDGTGLGLPEALRVVQRHQGTMKIESAWGAGTTITVVLPATNLADGPRELRPGSPPSYSSLHVLVVDDEPSVRNVMTE